MVDDFIKVGDRVMLRSGGPVMTVRARSQNLVYCAWTTEGRLHQGTFEIATLEAAPPPAPGSCDSDGEARPCA